VPSEVLAATGTIAPAWLVMPFAGLTLLVLAGHVLALGRGPMPASRRRIRTVNGVLMMATTPLVAYGFAMATPDLPRTFVMVWTLSSAMVFLVLTLAGLDVMNTLRLNHRERRRLRTLMRESRRKMQESRGGGGGGGTAAEGIEG